MQYDFLNNVSNSEDETLSGKPLILPIIFPAVLLRFSPAFMYGSKKVN
jgi:hypothetical protein